MVFATKSLQGYTFLCVFFKGSEKNDILLNEAKNLLQQHGATDYTNYYYAEFFTAHFLLSDLESLKSFPSHKNSQFATILLQKSRFFITLDQLKAFIQESLRAGGTGVTKNLLRYLSGVGIVDPLEQLRAFKVEETLLPSLLDNKGKYLHRGYVSLRKRQMKYHYRHTNVFRLSLHYFITVTSKEFKLNQTVPWKNRAAQLYQMFEKEDATTRSPLYQFFGLELMLSILEYVPLDCLKECKLVSRKFYTIMNFLESEYYKKMCFAIFIMHRLINPPAKPLAEKASSTASSTSSTTTTTTTSSSSSSSSATVTAKKNNLQKVHEIDYRRFFMETAMPLHFDIKTLEVRVGSLLGEWKPHYQKAIQTGLVFSNSQSKRSQIAGMELPIGTSKYGGVPDLPNDIAWPDGYRFLLQVNFTADLQHSLAVKRYMPTLKISTAPNTCTMMYFFLQDHKLKVILYSGDSNKLARAEIPYYSMAEFSSHSYFENEDPIEFAEVATFPEPGFRPNDQILKHYDIPKSTAPLQLNYHVYQSYGQFQDKNMCSYLEQEDRGCIRGTFLNPITAQLYQDRLYGPDHVVLLSMHNKFAQVAKSKLRKLDFEDDFFWDI